MIRFDHVYKHFTLGDDKLTVLKDIHMEINPGEFVSIIGPSGSGKSTLMYLIGLLDHPSEGKVFLNNIDTSRLSDERASKLRNEFIGFVFQQFNLINKLTVLENIMLPTIYYEGKLDFVPKDRALELLKRFGIDHRTYSYPNKLSGGEQQRVSIARALIMNPELILADEPTGNLDSKTGKIILDLLQELSVKDGKTVVVITHDTHIADKTQRKIKVKDGQIVTQL
jgi:ABC-type lipoprotein export system ATPase subunit